MRTDYGSRHAINTNITLRPDAYTQTYGREVVRANREYNPNSFQTSTVPSEKEHRDLMRFIRSNKYINGVSADQLMSNGTITPVDTDRSVFAVPLDFQRLGARVFGR